MQWFYYTLHKIFQAMMRCSDESDSSVHNLVFFFVFGKLLFFFVFGETCPNLPLLNLQPITHSYKILSKCFNSVRFSVYDRFPLLNFTCKLHISVLKIFVKQRLVEKQFCLNFYFIFTLFRYNRRKK